ncbi:MAG: RsmB/NOP family class I SAM-dependent RNA methyltransferase [Rhodoferax sp.]|nr:RsmB/NOP family class I SAM-dependent RNA methyltransferase [Rhodoferax sp.]
MHPKALLDTCADLLSQVLRLDHPSDAVVARYFREHRQLGPRERATLSDTVYAVLRRKLLFDHLAPSGTGSRERRLALLGFAGPGDFLRSALNDTERRWLDQCQAIDPAQLLDRHRDNLPDWLAQALRTQVGDELPALANALNQPAPLDLRVNTLAARRDEVLRELAQAGLAAQACAYSPWGIRLEGKPALNRLDAFTRGAIEIQDEGSQLLACLVDARRGEMVADFCAGAGGKTLALGASMRNTGRLYAFDTSAHRLDALRPRLARSGLSNVHPAAIAHERDERVKRLAGKLDRGLVDAPCSGLGTLRRHPDLKWRQSPDTVRALAVQQAAILAAAARLLKPGGRLVYATCSLLTEENEAVAQVFGSTHPDFQPLPAADLLAAVRIDAAPALCAGGDDGRLYLRLWPHRHGTDGFFAAVWQRA